LAFTNHKNKTMKTKNTSAGPFVAAFMHSYIRFMAGKKPGSNFETKMFKKLSTVSASSINVMAKRAKSFKDLPVKNKGKAAALLMKKPDKPITNKELTTSFIEELKSVVSNLAFDSISTTLEERPGKARLYTIEPGSDDVFPNQVHIFKINDIRTNDHVPVLRARDFKPEEFQQVCKPIKENGEIKWDCKMQRQPCDGYSIGDVCLRVPQFQNGASVTLTGVNFFDINAKVWIRRKDSIGAYKKVKAFVYGDTETPVYENVNGSRKLIADKRVKDKIFFVVPPNLAPGIYQIQVAVPNSSGISGYGIDEDMLFSNAQFIEVIPPVTARFQVASERLSAKDETGNLDFTLSDEIGIKVNSVPFFSDLSLGALQQHSFRFDNVDTGETRVMESVLFSHNKPIGGLIMSVMGYEIDSEDAYRNEVSEWTDIFWELLQEQWEIITGSAAAMAVIKKLAAVGFYGYIVIACSVLLTAAIDFFVSLWATPDLIIQDTLSYAVSDLGRMTNINIPKPQADPNKTLYTTPGGVRVRLIQNEKLPNEYTEERGYLSDDHSWYNIRFRFNRLS